MRKIGSILLLIACGICTVFTLFSLVTAIIYPTPAKIIAAWALMTGYWVFYWILIIGKYINNKKYKRY